MDAEALFGAFWCSVIIDLQRGDQETRLWLDTGEEVGGFLWWCLTTDKDAQWWRGRMLAVWRQYRERNSSASTDDLMFNDEQPTDEDIARWENDGGRG